MYPKTNAFWPHYDIKKKKKSGTDHSLFNKIFELLSFTIKVRTLDFKIAFEST